MGKYYVHNNNDIKQLLDNCLTICDIEKEKKSVKVRYSDNTCDVVNGFSLNKMMNIKFRNDRIKANKKGDIQSENLSTVWILIADDTVLQVGRNKNLNCMIAGDINPNRNAIIFRNTDSKYGKLLDSYQKITFYEVCIDKYLENDKELFRMLKNIKYDENEKIELMAMIYYIKASYVEGKIASLTKATMWNPSGGIDGDIFDLYTKSL